MFRIVSLTWLAPLVASAMAAGCGQGERAADVPASPASERPLLAAPDPSGQTARGVFLRDPRGQVEALAATGHLVAWTVRTPADTLAEESRRDPVRLPRATKIVVADERGGRPLSVAVRNPWVSELRMIRGPRGASEPQLAVRSCTTRRRKSCHAELLTLTPAAPLRIVRRTRGEEAEAAVDGTLDSGRRLDLPAAARRSSRRPCSTRLIVHDSGRSAARTLPRLPHARGCDELVEHQLWGDYAFATTHRTDPVRDWESDVVYALDIRQGAAARWRAVQSPYRYTAGSVGWAIGPALTDRAMYFEELNEDGSAYSLELVALPRDVRQGRSVGEPSTGDPVAPRARDVCAIAATDAAVYELANPRCAAFPQEASERGGGAIRRVVAPAFVPIHD